MYYPLNKISAARYTSGNELQNAITLADYTGYYFSTFDGKYFTGKTYTVDSIELSPKRNDQYNNAIDINGLTYNISRNSPNFTVSSSPISYIPAPSVNDYNRGFLVRYFIRRVNCGADTIREISKTDYSNFIKNVLYTGIQLNWMISGPDIFDNNVQTIQSTEKIFPGISLYLRDPLQFSRKIL